MKRILPVIVAVLIMMMGCLPTFANDDKDNPSKATPQPAVDIHPAHKYFIVYYCKYYASILFLLCIMIQ